MSRSSIPAALVGSWILVVSSCSLISFDQLSVTSYPAGRNQVIGRDERITLVFSIPPDRVDAEALACIQTPGGPAQVDYLWEGDLLVLVPAPALPMGERLVLSLSGDLAMEDGREFSVSVEVPFFVETSGPRPRLLACQPADGAPAGTRTALVFSFNHPMDGSSFADGFTLNPGTDVDTEWSPDFSTVTMTPRHQWENLVLYTWQVDASVKDRTGACLGVPSSGCFFTQIDAVPPSVLSLRPAAANLDGTFTVVEQPLDGNIRVRDCILLSFSEDVTMESLQRAFRLDPSVGGSFTRERAGDFYFVPARPWAMATWYHLVVSTDVEDLSGNAMAEDLSAWFVPRIPVQAVLSVAANGGPASAPGSPLPIDVTLTVDREVVFVVEFAEPFDMESRAGVPFAADCTAVFPSLILDPTLKSAAWASATSLTMVYAGFSPSLAPELHYYRLLFPGGPTGIPNADGSYLEEDAWVTMVAR